VTVKQACENYIAKLSAEGKQSSIKGVEGRFRRWVYANAKLSSTTLDKLTKTEIGEWRTKLSSTPIILQDKAKTTSKLRSASSLNRDMAVFKATLNLAFKDGHVASNSAWAHKLLPIKNASNRRTCYLDLQQRKALIAECPDDLGKFIKGLSLVPLRPGALATLDVKDYDHRLQELRVGKDKAGQERRMKLPASTADFFQTQTNGKIPEDPLFTQQNGKRWNKDAWKKPLKAAAKAARLPLTVTAYALRHSTITDLIAIHRLDTMTVARISGTSLVMIEKHYGHLLQGHAAKALEGLEL
jgi:integrase